MAANVDSGESLFDFRHMTCHAFVALAILLMMSMLFDRRSKRAVRRFGAMTIQAYFVRWFTQNGLVARSVGIVTTETSYSVSVHEAGDVVVALHAILVGRAVGVMSKCCFAWIALFKFPEVIQL